MQQRRGLVLLPGLSSSKDDGLVLASRLNRDGLAIGQTRVFEGVQVVEVVAFLAELDLGVASAELFHQETVVFFHHLPNQLTWN